METRALKVEGAHAFAAGAFSDTRGMFISLFQESVFTEATGHRLFPVAQVSYSVSNRGVVRGVHYTATPPGGAKYVYCARGRALDFVVDLRVGSPTFGRWDSLVLDQYEAQAVYFPVGVGHLFVALQEETVMTYTLSTEYVAENELAISPFDPDLGLTLPDEIEPVLSDRDRNAPGLAEARAQGMLPDHGRSVELEAALRPVPPAS